MATLRALGSTLVTSRPLIRMRPAVVSSRPATQLRSVDLPQPLAPEQHEEVAILYLDADVLEHLGCSVRLTDVCEF